MSAEVTRRGLLDMQVCVPTDWTDQQVLEFAERENPAGTEGGWSIRRDGNKWLKGVAERVTCEGRTGHVHLMLDV